MHICMCASSSSSLVCDTMSAFNVYKVVSAENRLTASLVTFVSKENFSPFVLAEPGFAARVSVRVSQSANCCFSTESVVFVALKML